jgi:tRNA-modifying protein YgfZ
MNTDETLSRVADAPALMFELAGFSQIEIAGPDGKSFLHSFCTNDINRLQPGQGCEAFIPNIKGRILGHVLAYATDDSLLLLAVPGAADAIVPHLQKYLLGVEAQVQDRSGERGLLCIAGSEAAERLESLTAAEMPQSVHEHRSVETPGGPVLLARTDLTLLPTYLLSGSVEAIDALRSRLADGPCQTGAPELLEALRIEAGFPWHGRDISEENIAQEAGRTERAISFTKGCYLGQEPIARLDAMGHTNKELRRLTVQGTGIASGDPLLAGDKDVGTVTSAAFVPALNQTLALGMVRAQHAAPRTELLVRTDGETLDAVVDSLP